MNQTFVTRRTLSAGIAAFAALSIAAGCGADTGGDAAPSSESEAAYNDTDVMFAQMMIPHHEQAIEMATLAHEQATDPEVMELAGQVHEAQQAEIDTLTGLLETWGESAEMDHEMDMDGMLSDEDMAALQAAEGAEFDAMFVHHMITHHQGAVAMAEAEIADGENAEAKAVAEAVIEAQTEEIATLEGIMERL